MRIFWIDVSKVPDFPDVLEEGDIIMLLNPKENTKTAARHEKTYDYQISKIENEKIYFNPEDDKLPNPSKMYRIRFKKDRFCTRLERDALIQVEPKVLSKIFFPEKSQIQPPSGSNKNLKFSWFNKDIATNLEQKQAIENIVKGSSYPAPYVIFGPPGTGKTSTIVETIAQIWTLKPHAKILITAPSNFACDEIALRLLKYIPAEDLYRLYSKSAAQSKKINSELHVISNVSTKMMFTHVDIRALMDYRIVLTTLPSSGRLNLKGMPKNHFSYIFLDECGSSTQAAALVPIAGLISFKKSPGKGEPTKVVIAGDPKQLGPVVMCNFSSNAGLGVSLLDRLMSMDLYKPSKNGKYNEKLITKLLQNFRSHPAILKVPNDLFYDGELQAKASNTNFALNWNLLPNKQFPIIFHGVNGASRKGEKSPSLYNEEEIKHVFNYVKNILKNGINGQRIPHEEIGIVSPYRLQCKKISDKLMSANWKNIEIGSAEQFQGKEKKIIILSTVRSNTPHCGFLNNPKVSNSQAYRL